MDFPPESEKVESDGLSSIPGTTWTNHAVYGPGPQSINVLANISSIHPSFLVCSAAWSRLHQDTFTPMTNLELPPRTNVHIFGL